MIIRTYAELSQYLKAFNKKSFNLLVIHSSGGTGKSRLTKELIKDSLNFSGHSTPLATFLEIQKRPDSKIVFDDTDILLNNKIMVALLKQVCDTEDSKIVRYTSTTKALDDKPQSFVSKNKVCLLLNDCKRVGHNIKALMTRGFYIHFMPSNAEIMARTRLFGDDTEILLFLEKHHQKLADFNLRIYVRAKELKSAGMDWKRWILKEFAKKSYLILLDEIIDLTIAERDSIWVERTGFSVRTLRRLIRKERNIGHLKKSG